MGQVTIGSTLYEVYGDLAGANAYFASVTHGAAWLALDGSVRNQALVTAMRVFERTGWDGTPTDPIDKTQPQPAGTQPLAWPRTGLVDREGVAVDSATIPADVISGAYEYALEVVTTPSVQTADSLGSNLKVEKTTERVEGAVTVSDEKQYFFPTLGSLPAFPKLVNDYIGLWLKGGASTLGLSFASGTDATSPLEGSGGDYGYTGDGLP